MQISTQPQRRTQRRIALLTVLAFALTSPLVGCTYKERVAPITLPDSSRGIVIGDVKISGHAITDPEEAQHTLGFNALKAGLLGVRLTFQNDGREMVTVNPDQTFLVDRNNNAWPILTKEQAAKRTEGYVDIGETAKGTAKPALLLGAAGAVAGAAIGIITGENVGEAMGKGAVLGAAGGAIIGGATAYGKTGETIRKDLATKTLRNEAILPQEIAYGFLFFPGTPGEEAEGAVELRLAISIGGRPQVVRLELR